MIKRALILFLISLFSFSCSSPVKEPAVAGSFYPADPGSLRTMVDGFLAKADPPSVNGRLIGLIVPHAGYVYSGQVAAYAYNLLRGRKIKTVILLGPSHHVYFKGVSIYTKGSFKTPLGKIKINSGIARRLIDPQADVREYPEAFAREHSLEVQLPFLQRTLEDFEIVPILIGSPTNRSYQHLTDLLTDILRKHDDILLLASTDLSHYHDYDTAVRMDSRVIDAIERLSIEDLRRYLSDGSGEICGAYPVIYTLTVARNIGATNGVLLRYANSADVTGNKNSVVGYAAIGIYNTPLTEKQKSKLLEIARRTIISYVKTGTVPDFKIKDKRLMANGATFVTIKTPTMRLRGCIGNIIPIMPLYKSVIRNAVAACSKDPRFPPMKKEELKDMEIEITILSPLMPVKSIDEIKVGRDGLYLVKGFHSGILLPQVPVEYGWDRETFLRQVSLKAGLNEDAWKEARLYRFTAEIIK